jgi:hypothetical protein
MNRQVVRSAPEKATPVQPTTNKPVVITYETKQVKDESGNLTMKQVQVTSTFFLASGIARL